MPNEPGDLSPTGTPIPLGSPVMVDWLDSAVEGSWCDVADIDMTPSKVRSLGYLIKFNRHVVILAADVDPKTPTKGDVNRVMAIPTGMVSRIKRVR